jgi:hypothetical protein
LDRGDQRFRFEAIAVLEIETFGGWHSYNFTADHADWDADIIYNLSEKY